MGTKAQFDALCGLVGANSSTLPALETYAPPPRNTETLMAQLQDLRSSCDACSEGLALKGDAGDVPLEVRQRLEWLTIAVGQKAERDWTQEQLKGVTDILLPLARTVRERLTPPQTGSTP